MASGGNFNGLGPHQRAFIKLLDANAYGHRRHEVFTDFCEMSALSISNRVDKLHFEAREARYFEIIKRYSPEEVQRFPLMLAEIQQAIGGDDFGDCLGELFMALDLGNHFRGQFFTPYSVSSLMARLTTGDLKQRIEEEHFITVHEPAVGAGAMVIAVADAIAATGHFWPNRMHAVCYDIDPTAVHMCYVQLSLLGIPAVVVHGNTLTLQTWGHWVTPMHVIGGWDARLAGQRAKHTNVPPAERTVVKDLAASMPSDPVNQAVDLGAAGAAIARERLQKAEQLGLFGDAHAV